MLLAPRLRKMIDRWAESEKASAQLALTRVAMKKTTVHSPPCNLPFNQLPYRTSINTS
jgi:hypothetical protein